MRFPVATVAEMSDAAKPGAASPSRRSMRQRRRRRSLLAVVSAAVAVAVAIPVLWSATDTGSDQSTTPRVKVSPRAADASKHFYIVGSDIVDP
jgi:hypothetical protein